MSIQDIFYILGSIFMGLGILLLIIIGVVLWTIKVKMTEMCDLIEKKVNAINRITDDPGGAAMQIGSKMAGAAAHLIKDAITKRGR